MGRNGAQPGVRPTLLAAVAAPLLTLLVACGASEPQGAHADPDPVDSAATPELGRCRQLTPDDVAQPSNATRTVPCTEKHTAQTFAVGELPAELTEAGYDDPEVGAFAYQTCTERLRAFLGADESTTMRSLLGWAWFRPSREAWEEGARWYRCDVVGGTDREQELIPLRGSARGLLQGRPEDRWMTCAAGESIEEQKVACSQAHDWRAVTTIKVGESEEEFPGESQVESVTRDFCADSVSAWLNYPVDYDYAFTWFGEAEWDAGNRRSICWARTDQ